MRTARAKLLLSAALATLLAPLSPAQNQGLPTEWDVRTILESITAHSTRLKPLLAEVRPKEWVAAGASETYIQQWNSTVTQADSLNQSAANLSREPEKLTAALDTFFRLQNIDVVLMSLTEGVRKYQNPALADLLRGVMSENGASRQQLQQYMLDLASLKEREFKIMDQEAQRCRTSLSKVPVIVPKKKVGK